MNDTFEQRIAHWSGLREPDKTAFYEQRLWGEVRQRFAAHTRVERFEVLVVPVSNPHTALLHLDHYRPQTAVFIYSEHSRRDHAARLQQAAAELGIRYEETTDVEPTDPVAVYSAMCQVVKRYPSARIAVDITGGTKAMSVGVAMAGSLVGATSVYIESRFNHNIQSRVPGTEQPHRLPDPYTVLGDLVRQRAEWFFRTHNYATAHELFSDLAQRIDPPQGDTARARLAAAYRDWDAFDLSAACNQMRALVADPLPVSLEAVRPALAAQAAALEKLADVALGATGESAEVLATLADPAAALALLGTLHTNALRREAQSRYDMAALLRYRCLELISQHRLATKGVLTENPDRQILDQLLQQYGVPENRQRSFRRSMSLFAGYKLLRELRDPLVQGYDIAQINQRSRARNTSILAHGYRLITRQEYLLFAAVVDELIDRLLALIPADRADWERTYTFAQPFGAP